jgi:hypothetical protein
MLPTLSESAANTTSFATDASLAPPVSTSKPIQTSPTTHPPHSRSPSRKQQQLSEIEKSVNYLLVAIKRLLEILTQWSRGTATEGEVSSVYVLMGYEFNIACRAYNNFGIKTQDLGPVPDLLRTILEDGLSQEASPASLDRFLPKIRGIIIGLLQGLKKKQIQLRMIAKTAKEMESSGSSSSPQDAYDSAEGDGGQKPP